MREFHAPAMFPQIIISRIHRQPVKPRLENLRRTELIERKIQPQKHFLADILHILGPRNQPRDGA